MTNENNFHELWNPARRQRSTRSRRQNVSVVRENVITQDELHELRKLKSQSEQYTRYRKAIRQRLLAGAEVEPGKWHVRIVTREMISFSQRVLQRVYGAQWVEMVRNAIPPQIHREMVIEHQGAQNPLGE